MKRGGVLLAVVGLGVVGCSGDTGVQPEVSETVDLAAEAKVEEPVFESFDRAAREMWAEVMADPTDAVASCILAESRGLDPAMPQWESADWSALDVAYDDRAMRGVVVDECAALGYDVS